LAEGDLAELAEFASPGADDDDAAGAPPSRPLPEVASRLPPDDGAPVDEGAPLLSFLPPPPPPPPKPPPPPGPLGPLPPPADAFFSFLAFGLNSVMTTVTSLTVTLWYVAELRSTFFRRALTKKRVDKIHSYIAEQMTEGDAWSLGSRVLLSGGHMGLGRDVKPLIPRLGTAYCIIFTNNANEEDILCGRLFLLGLGFLSCDRGGRICLLLCCLWRRLGLLWRRRRRHLLLRIVRVVGRVHVFLVLFFTGDDVWVIWVAVWRGRGRRWRRRQRLRVLRRCEVGVDARFPDGTNYLKILRSLTRYECLPGRRSLPNVAHGALEGFGVVSEGADGAVPKVSAVCDVGRRMKTRGGGRGGARGSRGRRGRRRGGAGRVGRTGGGRSCGGSAFGAPLPTETRLDEHFGSKMLHMTFLPLWRFLIHLIFIYFQPFSYLLQVIWPPSCSRPNKNQILSSTLLAQQQTPPRLFAFFSLLFGCLDSRAGGDRSMTDGKYII
jgi:hypothetical protein